MYVGIYVTWSVCLMYVCLCFRPAIVSCGLLCLTVILYVRRQLVALGLFGILAKEKKTSDKTKQLTKTNKKYAQ